MGMRTEIDNRRIAKNTIYLYARQIVIMLVSLYTSRIILQVLGVNDFGIYNVVAGVVVMFTFLNSSLSHATTRFLNFEMGRADKAAMQNIFCMSVNIHVFFAVIIFLVAETIGLWFVNNKLNIDADRMSAAFWAYQFSILSLCLQMLRVPYGATIVTYEKMDFYAYLSILDVVLRLGIVYLLKVIPFDKLIVYSALIPVINLGVLLINVAYTRHRFDTTKYRIFWDKQIFRKMMSFSCWSLLCGLSGTASNYGVNLIFNIFCGVIVNAAMGIANQVNLAVGSLVSSFQTAFAPQIVKSYAARNEQGCFQLITRSSKFSYFIMLLMTVPVVIFAEPLLRIWLVEVPRYTVAFTQLILIYSLIDALSGPFWHAANATGKVRGYYLITSILLLLNLPLSYILLKLGFSVIWAVFLRVLINVVIYIARILIVSNLMGFPKLPYCHELFRYVSPSMIMFVILYFIPYDLSPSLGTLIPEVFFVVIAIASTVYITGLTSSERAMVKNHAIRLYSKISRK